MEAKRFEQVDQILQAALERDGSEREAFLDEVCAGDTALRSKVEALISSDEEAGSFIETPAFEVAAEMMADEQSKIVAGQSIGPYEITSRLGSCGMGDVIPGAGQPAGPQGGIEVPAVTRESRSLTTFSGRADWLAIYPEGKKLAVVITGDNHTQKLVQKNLVDQSDSIIHQGAEYEHLRWSPDGLALAWNRPGPSINAPVISGGIWVMDEGQSEPRLLINEGYCPVWNGDGTAIYFSVRHGHQGLWRYHLDKRARQLVRNWGIVFNCDVVGRQLIFARHKNNSQIYSIAMNN
jgi:hypothetical protein